MRDAVECDVETYRGVFTAAVPSGASTGIYEALELRDGGSDYMGKGAGPPWRLLACCADPLYYVNCASAADDGVHRYDGDMLARCDQGDREH